MPARILVTSAGRTGRPPAPAGGGSATRRHASGPLAASGTDQRAGSWYQSTARASHCLASLAIPRTTTGSLVSGATSSDPATSYTSQVRCFSPSE